MIYGTAKNSKGLSSEDPFCSWKDRMGSPMAVGLPKTEPGTSNPYRVRVRKVLEDHRVHPCFYQCLQSLTRRASQQPFGPCWDILRGLLTHLQPLLISLFCGF